MAQWQIDVSKSSESFVELAVDMLAFHPHLAAVMTSQGVLTSGNDLYERLQSVVFQWCLKNKAPMTATQTEQLQIGTYQLAEDLKLIMERKTSKSSAVTVFTVVVRIFVSKDDDRDVLGYNNLAVNARWHVTQK